MAVVKWAVEAQQALREIHDHISRNRPETAQRTIESILNKTESLAEVPTQGQRYPHHAGAVHVFTYGHFRIAYVVEDEGDVKILGVFHGLIFLPLK
jgi:plasmid stabilization system protein ParE